MINFGQNPQGRPPLWCWFNDLNQGFRFTLNHTQEMKKFLFLVLLGSFSLAYSQNAPTINATLQGQVLDQRTQEPVIGASVVIKGTTNGALTDVQGSFSLITGQKLPFTLVISSVGYVRKEVVVNQANVQIFLTADENALDDVVVTSRRRQESSQAIPIPITVIRGITAEDAGAFQVNRIKELTPNVQLYASNARNTTLNIRGMGSTFGLTNDGIDPGVGFYVDGVYYARPAATALDLVDIDRIEILRGPQGTLFGKNTTAGAFNLTTRSASFDPSATVEVSYGNYGFIQAKASATGPLSKKVAARVSFTGTQRNGFLENVRTKESVNDLNNIGFRAQVLYQPNEKTKITLAGDISDQKPNGYGWPVAGVVTTQRPAFRQFNAILADLNYQLPYNSAFDRKVDHDTPSRADNQLGGASVQADVKIGKGTLTSTTAWRYWKWVPLNDRDYLGLPSFTISAGNSYHEQWSQEIRYAGNFSNKLSGVIGIFTLFQDLKSDPVQTEEAGSVQWRFIQNNQNPLWRTPGLLDNFGIRTTNRIQSSTAAIFSQLDWQLGQNWHVLPGLRLNYDEKRAEFNRQTYGGLATNDPALLALKNSVYTNQAFSTRVDETNLSGQLTLQYRPENSPWQAFGTYSVSYKPVGVNIGGLPTQQGRVMVELARVKPEFVEHAEIGLKTRPTLASQLNFTLYSTRIRDYQTQVQTPEPGVNRGYLANAERVRVQGIEVEGQIRWNNHWSSHASFSYTDGRYVKFTNAPVPLELVGGPTAFVDISGQELPGISRFAGSISTEWTQKGDLFSWKGNYFIGLDGFARSTFSSSPTPSAFLNIPGYALWNARVGFRASNGVTVLIWGRNLFDKNYYEQLLVAPGSSGHYAGIIRDPRTMGVTVRMTL